MNRTIALTIGVCALIAGHQRAVAQASHTARLVEALRVSSMLTVGQTCDIEWDGQHASNNWSEDTNWDPDGQPQDTDTVCHDIGGQTDMDLGTFASPYAIAAFFVEGASGAGTTILSGNGLSIAGTLEKSATPTDTYLITMEPGSRLEAAAITGLSFFIHPATSGDPSTLIVEGDYVGEFNMNTGTGPLTVMEIGGDLISSTGVAPMSCDLYVAGSVEVDVQFYCVFACVEVAGTFTSSLQLHGSNSVRAGTGLTSNDVAIIGTGQVLEVAAGSQVNAIGKILGGEWEVRDASAVGGTAAGVECAIPSVEVPSEIQGGLWEVSEGSVVRAERIADGDWLVHEAGIVRADEGATLDSSSLIRYQDSGNQFRCDGTLALEGAKIRREPLGQLVDDMTLKVGSLEITTDLGASTTAAES